MKKFSIISIDSVDGYERTATIEEIGLNNSLTVHFIEFGEYLDSGESSVCKKGSCDFLWECPIATCHSFCTDQP